MIASKHLCAVLFAVLLVLGFQRFWERYITATAEILFWDVGQGDSAFLKLPEGETYLIDSGGGWGNAQVGDEIAAELAAQSVLHLKGLFLSHLDSDHAGGSLAILRKIQVEKVFYPKAFDSFYSALLKHIKAESLSREIPVIPVREDFSLQGKDFTIRVWPMNLMESKKSNNSSLVIQIDIYGCRFLMTGDIEKEAENLLIKRISSPSTVLKVAHHGSLTSTQRRFLSRAQPRFSVISVGERNSYGHPKNTVLERLRFFRSRILRTDFHGFISFRINPKGKLTCTNALGSCGEYQCGT